MTSGDCVTLPEKMQYLKRQVHCIKNWCYRQFIIVRVCDKFRPHETHVTVGDAQTVTSIHRQRRRVFSHANGHKGAAIDCPKHLAPVVALRQWLWQALSKKILSSRFNMSHTCSIGERFRNIAGQGGCCTPRRARCVAAVVCGHALSCWKSTSPFCRRNNRSTGLTICAM